MVSKNRQFHLCSVLLWDDLWLAQRHDFDGALIGRYQKWYPDWLNTETLFYRDRTGCRMSKIVSNTNRVFSLYFWWGGDLKIFRGWSRMGGGDLRKKSDWSQSCPPNTKSGHILLFWAWNTVFWGTFELKSRQIWHKNVFRFFKFSGMNLGWGGGTSLGPKMGTIFEWGGDLQNLRWMGDLPVPPGKKKPWVKSIKALFEFVEKMFNLDEQVIWSFLTLIAKNKLDEKGTLSLSSIGVPFLMNAKYNHNLGVHMPA